MRWRSIWTRTDEYFQIVNIMMNERRYQPLDAAQQKILHDSALAAGVASPLRPNAGSPTRKSWRASRSR